jgi:hypothetical protein
VVVVPVIPVGKNHSALEKEVVLQGIGLVDGLYCLIERFVDVRRLCHRVFSLEVRDYVDLNVAV